MVKKVWRYDYSFWQNVRTWQTDRHTDTARRLESIVCLCLWSGNTVVLTHHGIRSLCLSAILGAASQVPLTACPVCQSVCLIRKHNCSKKASSYFSATCISCDASY